MNRVRNPFSNILISILVAARAGGVFAASEVSAPEYGLKAAFLLNFGRFVEWPAESAGGMRVCVVGEDPFGSSLDEVMRNQTVQGKPVEVHRYPSGQTPSGCRILFIASSEKSRLKSLLESARKEGALTVSEIPGFIEKGGMIQFLREGDRVRFSINLESARESHLKLSSKLLAIAKGAP